MAVAEAYPIISRNSDVQATYERMRAEGTSHSMAEILATRTPPGTGGTDRAFMAGRQNGQDIDGMLDPVRKKRMRTYKRLTGRDMPSHARYMSQIARFPGDPNAVVESIDDFKKKLTEGGHGCEEVGVKAAEPKPRKRIALAEPLVQNLLKQERAKPENAGKRTEELREKIIDKHAYKGGRK